jgi:hypothetical protein
MGVVVTRISPEEHRALARWAADCAERVLELYERDRPGDDRPRRAVQAARGWAGGGAGAGSAREAASAAQAAARATSDPAARAAARSAGHAAATADQPRRAGLAATYAATAASSASATDASAAALERRWQHARLPDRGLERVAFPA